MANADALVDDSVVDEFDDDCSLSIEDTPLRSEVDPPNALEDLAPVDLWDECLRMAMEGSLSPSSQTQTKNFEKRENESSASHFLGTTISTQCNHSDDELESVRSLHPRLVSVGGIYKSTYNDSFFENMSGGAFCNCYARDCQPKWKEQVCVCGEDDQDFDWVWDESAKSWACYLQRDRREVRFHKHYSSGTATVRGTKPLVNGQHYWEIKMVSPVYGTDMMIGIGTAEADLNRDSTTFCSFLGSNSETWGLSYTGVFYHAGKSQYFSSRFGQGAIIGVHLDTWKGSLSFYKNRKLIGVACEGLKGKVLYPMVSSTAARSGMRMVKSCSYNSSLKYFSLQAIRSCLPNNRNLLDTLSLPPGLAVYLRNNLTWLLGPPECQARYHHCQHATQSCCPKCRESSSSRTELFLENQVISPEFANSERFDVIVAPESPFGSYLCSRKKLPTNILDDEESARGRPKRQCFQMAVLEAEEVSLSTENSSTSDESDSDDDDGEFLL